MEINELKIANNYQSIVKNGIRFVIETYDHVNFEIAACPIDQIETLKVFHCIKAKSDVKLQQQIENIIFNFLQS